MYLFRFRLVQLLRAHWCLVFSAAHRCKLDLNPVCGEERFAFAFSAVTLLDALTLLVRKRGLVGSGR